MNLVLTLSPAEIKSALPALAAQIPALAQVEDLELSAGHVDATVKLPKIGGVVVRLQVNVTETG